jgi:tRNA(Arg) A34 adenosine deaminase TadA
MHRLTLNLPDWIGPLLAAPLPDLSSVDARMRLAIDLARRNVESGTGGPFGALVFDLDAGRLVSVGVNVVLATRCSVAHAELMALALAQQACGGFDLGAAGLGRHELVTSSEPCAMCFGAIPWSGVRRLVCGARDADARAIGFDEGPKPTDWVRALDERGIEVEQDRLRDEARAVLRAYAEAGGAIYNARGLDVSKT